MAHLGSDLLRIARSTEGRRHTEHGNDCQDLLVRLSYTLNS